MGVDYTATVLEQWSVEEHLDYIVGQAAAVEGRTWNSTMTFVVAGMLVEVRCSTEEKSSLGELGLLAVEVEEWPSS